MRSIEIYNEQLVATTIRDVCKPSQCCFADRGVCNYFESQSEVLNRFDENGLGCEKYVQDSSENGKPGILLSTGRVLLREE